MITKEQRQAWKKILKENKYRKKLIRKIIKNYKAILYKKKTDELIKLEKKNQKD